MINILFDLNPMRSPKRTVRSPRRTVKQKQCSPTPVKNSKKMIYSDEDFTDSEDRHIIQETRDKRTISRSSNGGLRRKISQDDRDITDNSEVR